MPSELMLTVYLGVVPLILVVGIVQAIRNRDRLGPRSSKQLIAGAALMLLMHAATPVRVLLGPNPLTCFKRWPWLRC